MPSVMMSKEQSEKIDRVKKEMLERTNMTENEAYDFAFRCWQCGLDFTEELEQQLAYECGCNAQLVDLQKENEKLKKVIDSLVESLGLEVDLDHYNLITVLGTIAFVGINNEVAKELELLKEVLG